MVDGPADRAKAAAVKEPPAMKERAASNERTRMKERTSNRPRDECVVVVHDRSLVDHDRDRLRCCRLRCRRTCRHGRGVRAPDANTIEGLNIEGSVALLSQTRPGEAEGGKNESSAHGRTPIAAKRPPSGDRGCIGQKKRAWPPTTTASVPSWFPTGRNRSDHERGPLPDQAVLSRSIVKRICPAASVAARVHPDQC
jgi:hypothetical protein